MTKTIDNSEDVIDSRDVIERLKELKSERDDAVDKLREASETLQQSEAEPDSSEREELREAVEEAEEDLETWDDDNSEELNALKELNKEGGSATSEWPHGEALIRESYFVKYCKDMLEDIGDLPKDIPHYIVIDWEATARNLKADYSEVEFGDVTYLIRSN